MNFRRFLSKELKGVSTDKAFQEATELYRFMGFGRVNFSRLTARGGIAYADSSYYVTA